MQYTVDGRGLRRERRHRELQQGGVIVRQVARTHTYMHVFQRGPLGWVPVVLLVRGASAPHH